MLKNDNTSINLTEAKNYYEDACDEKKLAQNYKNILEKYSKLLSIWK